MHHHAWSCRKCKVLAGRSLYKQQTQCSALAHQCHLPCLCSFTEVLKEACFILSLLAVKPEYQHQIASAQALPGLIKLLTAHNISSPPKPAAHAGKLALHWAVVVRRCNAAADAGSLTHVGGDERCQVTAAVQNAEGEYKADCALASCVSVCYTALSMAPYMRCIPSAIAIF